MIVEESSRLRALRLLLIISALFAVGFGITGILIRSWFYALMGLLLAGLMSGIGLGLNYFLKKENGVALLLKYLMPALYIFLGLQVLIAIAKYYR